ncbi:hypothetical protein ACPW7J_03095 [Ihubacter sp. rT4E-8]|uniref:hypothetical protein n=1 Tax=Ihubacter sp. rT4E-8 TaxID=3242369 RepID=UPI003CE771F8
MRKRDRDSFSPPAVGGATLLVIFAVLCLTVFSLLSLTTVRADSRLSEASAQAVSDYYAADCEAQTILARLRSGEMPDCVKVKGNRYTYTCSISENQELSVVLRLDGDHFSILRWQEKPCRNAEIDDHLPVWEGVSQEKKMTEVTL